MSKVPGTSKNRPAETFGHNLLFWFLTFYDEGSCLLLLVLFILILLYFIVRALAAVIFYSTVATCPDYRIFDSEDRIKQLIFFNYQTHLLSVTEEIIKYISIHLQEIFVGIAGYR